MSTKKRKSSYHVVCFSGGKKSTAMLILMIQKSLKFDEVLFIDTGCLLPEVYENVKKMDEYLFKRVGKHITTIKSRLSFDRSLNNQTFTLRTWELKHNWCTRILKRKVMKKWLLEKTPNYDELYLYMGFSIPQGQGIRKFTDVPGIFFIKPLQIWKVSSNRALSICLEEGFDCNGLFEMTDRVRCYCCPKQDATMLAYIRDNHPKEWEELLEIERKQEHLQKVRRGRTDHRLHFKGLRTIDAYLNPPKKKPKPKPKKIPKPIHSAWVTMED